MIINAIKKGIVIDHIEAGLGIKLFYYLKLDRADFNVALITNAPSQKCGKKDIIKIQNIIDLDYQVLGLIDPNLTINIIEDEVIIKKAKLKLPKTVTDVIICKNPRCITSIEKYVPHIFTLVNEETAEYKCSYCDEILTSKEI